MDKEVLFQDYTYTKYYTLVISNKSYKYISFNSLEDMNKEIDTPHSATNIVKLALSKIGEVFSFYSGTLNDEQFEFIQKQIKDTFNQDINRLTSKAADLSAEFDYFINNKGQ
jgi:hypothetical protein